MSGKNCGSSSESIIIKEPKGEPTKQPDERKEKRRQSGFPGYWIYSTLYSVGGDSECPRPEAFERGEEGIKAK